MSRYCDGCGHALDDKMLFCDKCGRKVQPLQSAQTQSAPPAPYATPSGKSGSGLFLGLGVGMIALVFVLLVVAGGGALAVFVFNGSHGPTRSASPSASGSPALSAMGLYPFPDELKVDPGVKVSCQYKSPDYIIPANYRSLDYVVYLKCSTDRGHTKLMVSVEIPEFTQKYEQMIDVSHAETELTIRPPLLKNAAQSLNSARDAQIVVTVKDMNSGMIVLQDTKPVKLYSFYDMKWQNDDGTPNYENILAWVTPEAPEILKMLRDSADSCKELTGGKLDAIVGYQQVGNWSKEDITGVQVLSMMYTLAKTYNVQYNNASFSSTSSELQRIATPAAVIDNRAGLCIETAVTMASAIQSTGMHAVIILLPGHAQVAVETWKGSGEYILVETTALDAAREQKFDSVAKYMTKQQWKDYLAQDGYAAIDCALAEQLNITPIN